MANIYLIIYHWKIGQWIRTVGLLARSAEKKYRNKSLHKIKKYFQKVYSRVPTGIVMPGSFQIIKYMYRFLRNLPFLGKFNKRGPNNCTAEKIMGKIISVPNQICTQPG